MQKNTHHSHSIWLWCQRPQRLFFRGNGRSSAAMCGSGLFPQSIWTSAQPNWREGLCIAADWRVGGRDWHTTTVLIWLLEVCCWIYDNIHIFWYLRILDICAYIYMFFLSLRMIKFECIFLQMICIHNFWIDVRAFGVRVTRVMDGMLEGAILVRFLVEFSRENRPGPKWISSSNHLFLEGRTVSFV